MPETGDNTEPAVPLGDFVHRRLIDMIARGEFGANEPLREARLAELLGTSRMPVREALLRLEEEGWVSRTPRRGARVRTPTKQDIDEVFDLRRLLEEEAVRLAIPFASMYEVEELRKAIRQEKVAAEQADLSGVLQASRAFHGGIARLTRNTLLVQFLKSLEHRVQWLIAPTAFVRLEGNCLLEHEAILKAIEDRDRVRATLCVRQHIEATRLSLYQHWNAASTQEQRQAWNAAGLAATDADFARTRVD